MWRFGFHSLLSNAGSRLPPMVERRCTSVLDDIQSLPLHQLVLRIQRTPPFIISPSVKQEVAAAAKEMIKVLHQTHTSDCAMPRSVKTLPHSVSRWWQMITPAGAICACVCAGVNCYKAQYYAQRTAASQIWFLANLWQTVRRGVGRGVRIPQSSVLDRSGESDATCLHFDSWQCCSYCRNTPRSTPMRTL